MKKSKVTFYIAIISFLLSLPVVANMDKSLTIWGTRISTPGFGEDKRIARKYFISALKKHSLYVVTDAPTTKMRLKQEGATVTLTVKSALTGTIFYNKKFFIEGKGNKALKSVITRLVGNLKNTLPYHGLIYSKRRDFIKLNVGSFSGLRKGDRYETIRFTGDAPKKFILDDSDFPHEVTGEIEILSVKRNSSIAKVISMSPVSQFDKIIIEREAGRFTSDPIKKGVKLYVGTVLSSLSVSSTKESTAIDKPDTGKKFTFANPIPYLGMSAWFTKKYGASIEFQYRKVPLKLDSGTKLKATYMVLAPEFLVAFDKFNDNNVIALAGGLYMYYNTLDTSLMYYISTKYMGPQLGFDWSQKNRAHTGTLKVRILPGLSLTEDQTKRGEKSTSSGWYINLVYDYDLTAMMGITSTLFYRSIKSNFDGTASVGIDESDTYSDVQYGIKLLFSLYFPMW